MSKRGALGFGAMDSEHFCVCFMLFSKSERGALRLEGIELKIPLMRKRLRFLSRESSNRLVVRM